MNRVASRNQRPGVIRTIRNFFTNHLRQATHSLGELWRTPLASVMTMAVLGLSLSLPSALYLVEKNSRAVSDSWQNAAEITLFLRKDLSTQLQQAFVHRIGLYEAVDSVVFISPDDALKEFESQSGFGNAVRYLDNNPLPPVVIVTPNAKHSSADAAKLLLQKLEQNREVSFGRLDIEWLKRLDGVLALMQDSVGGLAALLLISVLLIVGNTIRLAILNRRDEIEVMKLVGASDSFIQRPFLYTGLWYGLAGAFIAWVAVELLLWWLTGSIKTLSGLYQASFQLQGLNLAEALGLLVIASVLGLTGAFIAVKRHIDEIEPS